MKTFTRSEKPPKPAQARTRSPASRDTAGPQESNALAQRRAVPDGGPQARQLKRLQQMADDSPQARQTAQRQASATASAGALPDDLRVGIEHLSGVDMSGVAVHRNSSRPAQLQAHAYAQGEDIHLAPGQDAHLPHEAWHVVQQKQGRVAPTLNAPGGVPVNDDPRLEHEADTMGRRALNTPVQRKTKDIAPSPATGAPARDVAQLGKKDRRHRKPDRHGQKEAARKKHDGTLFEERPQPREAVHEEEEDAPVEHLPKKTIAAEFTKGLRRLGLNPFLSGGAALNWQGGKRAVSDLDFRISTEEAGFTSFDEPRGKAILTAINDEILVESRQAHAALAGASADIFAPVGGGALTIGTPNWFGIECSLSITGKTPKNLKTLPFNVRALGVEEIQADKLKAMITRTKRGDASVSKVANDLFDFLDATRLIDASRRQQDARSDHPDPEIRRLHDEMAAQQPRKTAARRNYDRSPPRLTMAEHVDIAARARADEYRIANLETEDMRGLDDDAIADRMRSRAVLTALAHGQSGKRGTRLKGGARGKAFGKVADDASLASLGELASLPIDEQDKSSLRPWMAEWNQGPDYGPRKRGGKMPIQSGEASAPVPQPAAELLAKWPDGGQDNKIFKRWRREKLPDCIAIIKVLVLDEGFRPLPDSRNSVDTLLAFGMKKKPFSTAYQILKGEGFVRGEPDGLHLTDLGKETFRLSGDGS